jgi:multisubunit Na+/H+ antiporter MnhF subunit
MPGASERRPSVSFSVQMLGSRSVGDCLLYCLFVGGFVGTLAFFAAVDVYEKHFFERSYAAIYNAFRLIFAAYFFWLVYVVGRQALSLVADEPLAGMRPHERLALGFFVGAAALTIVMLVLGYLSLYWRVVAWLIAIPIIAASYRHFVLTVREAGSSVAQHVQDGSWIDRILSILMIVVAVLAGATLLLVKGLYPQGGHDYYQHYSQFYAAVIDSHGIWPNLFWYQYYYSKGMGVTFLGMLLTDALAPSLVAYCFVIATALALYALVRDFCSRTLWPWLAVVLYLALNVHTLGTGAYLGNGGWGHFQKPHEINSPILFAVLWMSVTMVRSAGDRRRVWWFGAAACAFVVAYVLLVSPLIVGLFAVLAALYFFAKNRDVSRMFMGIAVAGGVGLASLLVLNYLTTGAPTDVASNIWWPILDLRRLNDEGMLFDFVNIAVMRARGAVEGSAMADGFDFMEYARNVFRFDILGVLIGAALMGGLACMIYRDVLRRRAADSVVAIDAASWQAVGVVAAFLVATAAFAFTAGMLESVSSVRITSFALPLMIAISAIAGQLVTVAVGRSRRAHIIAAMVAPILLMSVLLVQAYEQRKPTLLAVVHNALRFADGRYSIYDAYRDQAGWPVFNRTAIHPGMYEAWKRVGPGKRIWSFSMNTYCMLPGCRFESLFASSMSRHRGEILSGPPENAERLLRREGLDYFFVSTRVPIVDVLQCAPLFSPDTIQSHLDVVWTDGTDVLLTWKGEGGERLSGDWLDKYRKAFARTQHLFGCGDEGSGFGAIGQRVSAEIKKGKRWGAEIPLPK